MNINPNWQSHKKTAVSTRTVSELMSLGLSESQAVLVSLIYPQFELVEKIVELKTTRSGVDIREIFSPERHKKELKLSPLKNNTRVCHALIYDDLTINEVGYFGRNEELSRYLTEKEKVVVWPKKQKPPLLQCD